MMGEEDADIDRRGRGSWLIAKRRADELGSGFRNA